jgi:hypothetical protein
MNALFTGGRAGVARGEAADRFEPVVRLPLWLWLSYSAMLAAIATVGATSFWMEADRQGRGVPLWPFALDEATSVLVVFALTPLLIGWTARLHPQRIGWVRTLIGHCVGMFAFSLLHVSGMMMLRLLASLLSADAYSFGGEPLFETVVYEGRKDALTYAGLVVGTWLVSAALVRPADARQVAAAAPRIEIRDGARRIWLDPAEIVWAEAAGNYVELHLVDRTVLRRQTLSALERELGDMDFLRIHRSRLVNGRHVLATETNDSGDFTVALRNGRQISGSRRWRGALSSLGTPRSSGARAG